MRMMSYVQFFFDLGKTLITNPKWFFLEIGRKLMDIRASGNARFKYRLRKIWHHRLDPRMERLEVILGGASWVDYSKAMIVTRFCKLLQPTKVLEIGTFRGGMAFHIARNTPDNCRIWTLDLPREMADNKMKKKMINTDVDLVNMDPSCVGTEWVGSQESGKIIQLWGDSLKFDFHELGPFELIYIDGSHARLWVERDTENAFKLLAPTGAILWDDCYWKDVMSVLGQYGRSYPIYLFEDGRTAGYFQIDGKSISVN